MFLPLCCSVFFCSGNFAEALVHYEKGIYNDMIKMESTPAAEIQEHLHNCHSGIARTSIKQGDYRKGVSNELYCCCLFIDYVFCVIYVLLDSNSSSVK